MMFKGSKEPTRIHHVTILDIQEFFKQKMLTFDERVVKNFFNFYSTEEKIFCVNIIKILTPIDFIFDALEKDFSTVPLEHTNIEIEKEFVKLLVLEMSLSLFQVEEYFNNFIKVKEEEIDKILDKGTSLEEKMVFFLK